MIKTAAAYIATFFVVGPILFIIQGWSISTLWNWFIAPLGVPQIGVATALGISLTTSLLRFKGRESEEKRTHRERLERLVGFFLVPVIGVGIGWIVLQFQ